MTGQSPNRVRRVIYHKTFRMLSFCLVLSAIAGGLYGDRLHFHYGLALTGAICIMLSWFDYLRSQGVRVPKIGLPVTGGKIPFYLKKPREFKLNKPIFLMSSHEFDDDLSSRTRIDGQDLSPRQLEQIGMWSKAFCGALLTVLSFIIGP